MYVCVRERERDSFSAVIYYSSTFSLYFSRIFMRERDIAVKIHPSTHTHADKYTKENQVYIL